MDQPRDSRDEELSGGQPPPQGGGGGSYPAQVPELPYPDYRIRLLQFKDKCLQIHAVMANITSVMIVIILAYIFYYVVYIISMFVVAAIGIGTNSFSGSGPGSGMGEMYFALIPIAGFAVGLVIAIIIVSLLGKSIRKWIDGMHQTRYKLAASYLHHTDFLRVVAEEDFTQIIMDAVNELPSLKWISPQKPKKIEDQLEFSASYWNSVLQLSYGPGRLDNASLVNGSWNYQVSRISLYFCCTCCCLANSLAIFIIPLLIITSNYHLYRVARVCCMIDYIVEDRFAGTEQSGGTRG